MSIVNDKLANRISWIIFILLAVQTVQALSSFTDVPPPPTRPERFNSREELRRYLQLVHEYYAIIGRPRFGRSMMTTRIDPSFIDFFNSFDTNGDQSITFDEFYDRLAQ